MIGNKENDGFLDGLARRIADVAIWMVGFYIIYYIIRHFILSFLTLNWSRMIMWTLIIIFFMCLEDIGNAADQYNKEHNYGSYNEDIIPNHR